MTSDWTPGDVPPNDTEWAWFADAYRMVPGPRPDIAAHAVQAATASLAKWHIVRLALKWILGTATGVGLVVVGHSLVKSRTGAPAPTRPAPSVPAAPAPDRGPPAATPTDSAGAPAPKPTPKPNAPAPAVTPAQPTPPAPVNPAPSTPDTTPDTTTVPDDQPMPNEPLMNYGLSQAEMDRLRSTLGEPTMRDLAKLIQDAVQANVPPISLIERTLESVAQNLPPAGVLERVQHRLDALRDARATLGPDAADYELFTAADVLEAGATTAQLDQVARHAMKGRAVAGFSTLAALVSGGVPAQDAANAVSRYLADDASDNDLNTLWAEVTADIARGTPALDALHAQVKKFAEDSAMAVPPQPADTAPRPAP